MVYILNNISVQMSASGVSVLRAPALNPVQLIGTSSPPPSTPSVDQSVRQTLLNIRNSPFTAPINKEKMPPNPTTGAPAFSASNTTSIANFGNSLDCDYHRNEHAMCVTTSVVPTRHDLCTTAQSLESSGTSKRGQHHHYTIGLDSLDASRTIPVCSDSVHKGQYCLPPGSVMMTCPSEQVGGGGNYQTLPLVIAVPKSVSDLIASGYGGCYDQNSAQSSTHNMNYTKTSNRAKNDSSNLGATRY